MSMIMIEFIVQNKRSYYVPQQCINKYPDSYFSAALKPHWNTQTVVVCEDGGVAISLHIDRHCELFQYIAEYLRYGVLPRDKKGHCLVPAAELPDLRIEADFFCLSELVAEIDELLNVDVTCASIKRMLDIMPANKQVYPSSTSSAILLGDDISHRPEFDSHPADSDEHRVDYWDYTGRRSVDKANIESDLVFLQNILHEANDGHFTSTEGSVESFYNWKVRIGQPFNVNIHTLCLKSELIGIKSGTYHTTLHQNSFHCDNLRDSVCRRLSLHPSAYSLIFQEIQINEASSKYIFIDSTEYVDPSDIIGSVFVKVCDSSWKGHISVQREGDKPVTIESDYFYAFLNPFKVTTQAKKNRTHALMIFNIVHNKEHKQDECLHVEIGPRMSPFNSYLNAFSYFKILKYHKYVGVYSAENYLTGGFSATTLRGVDKLLFDFATDHNIPISMVYVMVSGQSAVRGYRHSGNYASVVHLLSDSDHDTRLDCHKHIADIPFVQLSNTKANEVRIAGGADCFYDDCNFKHWKVITTAFILGSSKRKR